MEGMFSNLVKQINLSADNYIAEILSHYTLLTNNPSLIEVIKKEYPKIDIRYCRYLLDEHQGYVLVDNVPTPIEVVYEEPIIETDNVNMTYTAKCSIRIYAGDKELI